MIKFLTDNSTGMRIARTIVQGCIGVVVANIDTIINCAGFSAEWKPIVVALVMAVLSPLMSEIGKNIE